MILSLFALRAGAEVYILPKRRCTRGPKRPKSNSVVTWKATINSEMGWDKRDGTAQRLLIFFVCGYKCSSWKWQSRVGKWILVPEFSSGIFLGKNYSRFAFDSLTNLAFYDMITMGRIISNNKQMWNEGSFVYLPKMKAVKAHEQRVLMGDFHAAKTRVECWRSLKK